jgi:hypothetical protein
MNFDKTNVYEEDNDYGHFCILEENTHANNYVQMVYIQNNRYNTLHNYDKPSLYPVDYYYYDNSMRVTMPGKIKFDKENTQKKYYHNNHKNDDRDDDDDNHKGVNKKIFIFLTHMCVFSIFVSTVVVVVLLL